MAEAKLNRINLSEKDYEGAASTMCRGCGHDAISASVMRAYFDSSIDPRKVIKLSGIGCSSKTPAYFLSQSFGFNAVHGRMSAVATGANLANHTLMPIGVSGDGDTSAIGLGNFCHMMRRNVNIAYIIENNGVYGLTKGQFSATADVGSVMKGGKVNDIRRSIWPSWRSRWVPLTLLEVSPATANNSRLSFRARWPMPVAPFWMSSAPVSRLTTTRVQPRVSSTLRDTSTRFTKSTLSRPMKTSRRIMTKGRTTRSSCTTARGSFCTSSAKTTIRPTRRKRSPQSTRPSPRASF